VLEIQQGFQKAPQSSAGVSIRCLKFNRGFKRLLKVQQGFQYGA
jgi:hypothetical protein